MVVKLVNIRGAALHTRNNQIGQDYDWYVKTGKLQLFDKMDDVFRMVLRDISENTVKFAVVTHERQIGLLITDLPCERIDHSKRIIHNTLYLEFHTKYYKTVLNAAATLLLLDSQQINSYKLHFTKYTEKLFQDQTLDSVKLPVIFKQPDFKLPKIKQGKMALFSNPTNQNRAARYLIHLYRRHRSQHFTFVSTGRVSLEKCQQLAAKNDVCIILSSSSEVAPEISLKVTHFSRFKAIYSKILEKK